MGYGFGSNAMENFNKIVAKKKEMAKKMKRGPYIHHAKEPLKEARDVSNFPKGKSIQWYKENGYM